VSSQNKQVTENELLIVVTPRILNAPEREAGELIPLPSSPTP
jgi:hypothetical protein